MTVCLLFGTVFEINVYFTLTAHSVQISHISRAQQPQVAGDYCTGDGDKIQSI